MATERERRETVISFAPPPSDRSASRRPTLHSLNTSNVVDVITAIPEPDSIVRGLSAQSHSLANDLFRDREYFRSRKLVDGDIRKPWLEEEDRSKKWLLIIPLVGLATGLFLASMFIYKGFKAVTNHTYCDMFIENFNGMTLDESVWTKEVELGGFGNGEFEYTTNGDENVYIENGQLIIKPTLWDDETVLTSNYTLNLTALGTCTAMDATDCVASTNTSSGTIINPIKSGRVNTRKAAYIKYGRVEVEAQLPVGDWIWPAIWMLPVVNTYGAWPASGEIDLVESRGNNHTYAQGGNNIISSTMHWGPNSNEDSYWRTSKKHSSLHSTYTAGFHKFGLEWSDSYLFTYVDSRLQQVLYSPFNEPQWTRGDFPSREGNEVLVDPWSQTGRDSTPFDTEFYLILNVAVGSTNGWFEDGKSGKPWVDDAPSAMADFWAAKDEWYPTWIDGKAQMTIKSIKIWQQCN